MKNIRKIFGALQASFTQFHQSHLSSLFAVSPLMQYSEEYLKKNSKNLVDSNTTRLGVK